MQLTLKIFEPDTFTLFGGGCDIRFISHGHWKILENRILLTSSPNDSLCELQFEYPGIPVDEKKRIEYFKGLNMNCKSISHYYIVLNHAEFLPSKDSLIFIPKKQLEKSMINYRFIRNKKCS